MRKGRPVLVLLLVLLLPLTALVYVAASGERSIRALQLAVATFSPYSLSLRDAALSWRPLSFRADLLQLHYANADLPPLVAAQGIDLEMPMAILWGGNPRAGSFTARNVTYYLDDTSGGGDVDLEALLSPLGWLPGQIDIASVHVVKRGENVWVFPLLNVSGRRGESGALALITETYVGARRVVFEALGDWSLAAGDGHWLTIEAAFFGSEDDSRLAVDGRIEADGERLRFDFSLEGEYRHVGDFLTALDENAFAIDGALSVAGRLSGDTEGYELFIEDLTLSQEGGYDFAAKGRITQRGDEAPELALAARGEVQQLTRLLPLPENLAPMILRSDLRLTVAGTLQAPRLTEAAVDLSSPGRTQVTLTSPDLDVDLARLQTIENLDGMNLRFEARSADLPALLIAAGVTPVPEQVPSTLSLLGDVRVEGEALRLELTTMEAAATAYDLTGSSDALWRAGALSLPRIDVTIVPRDLAGRIGATGSIADLITVRGLALDVDVAGLDARVVHSLDPSAPSPPAGLGIDARARVTRAADALWLHDLRASLHSASGLDARLSGKLLADRAAPEGDLDVDVTAPPEAWADFDLPAGPARATGQLRLRPAYLTLLATLTQGTSELQAVLNAGLAQGTPTSLGLDVWGADTRLEDFLPTPSNPEAAAPGEEEGEAAAPEDGAEAPWADRLPRIPVRFSLRSNRLYSDHTELRDVSVAIEGENGNFVLRNFDSRYDDGDLSLRGVLNLNTAPPSLSLAGQGIRVPLAALTEDLGLQQSITGQLSLRGGLSAQGLDSAGISRSLRGHVALALSDVTVSGAAYDLLMSNLLAWLVQGAGEKTTTFDCTMAQFDVENGVARSSELFVETTRMLATGKGRIDLPGNRIDLRIEPRSKSRTFQFPSAIHLRGPLDDPGVEVSGLQATADLSAQALLLLPSLTLKLFGVGRSGDAPRPCRTEAG